MADCEEEKFYAVTDTFGGPKPVPSCNPADERVPDELREPTGDLSVPPTRRLPNPVRLYNVKKALTCFDIYDPDGPDGDVYGPGAVVPDGYYTGTVTLSLVSDITDEQLEYIASNNLTERLSVLFHSYVMAETPKAEIVAGIAALLRVTEDKALLVYNELNRIQTSLDYEAFSQAAAMLSCYWLNREARVSCWDGLSPEADPVFATYTDHKDAVVEYFVPAGLLKSTISQADADSKADSMAKDSLNCFYVSDNVNVSCTDPDRPGKPSGGGDVEVPVERQSVISHMPPRNGNVVIPKGAYTSRISRAEATKAARDYAYSLLVCYYFNDYVRRTCGLSEARGIGIDPLVEGPAVADVESKVYGQEAIVPYGSIVSQLSPDDANRKAAYIAESLLECCYISPEVHVECPAVYIVDEHGNPVLEPDGKQAIARAVDRADYANSSFTLPRGAFTGCVDDDLTSEETNEAMRQSLIDRANEAANLELSCIYCNKLVLPSCVPEWVIRAATKGIELPSGDKYYIQLPLDPDNIINPYTGEKEDTSTWSKDATVGFKAEYFCAEDYYTAQRLADSEGVELLSTKGAAGKVDDTCTFSNSIVHASCMAQNIYTTGNCDGSTVTEGRYRGIHMETGVRGEACGGGEYIWLSVVKWGTQCALSSESTPPICEYVTVDPGTIKVSIAETPGTIPAGEPDYSYDDNARKAKAYANKLAIELALSSLCCKKPPTTVIGYCVMSTAKQTRTQHGVYDDMPTRHSVGSRFEIPDDRECCGCVQTVTVLKGDGLAHITEYSNTEANPIIMDYTPEGCFNAFPYRPAQRKDGSELESEDTCEESEALDEKYNPQGQTPAVSKAHQFSLQDVINTVAASVVCMYGNTTVEGSCESGELTQEGVPRDKTQIVEVISDHVVIPENTIVADLWYKAQIIAESLADSLAKCSYGNMEIQATCTCNAAEYENQLEPWESIDMLVPFKCGKIEANTLFAGSFSLANRMARNLAELASVCRIKPCEDKTPFHVSYIHDKKGKCHLKMNGGYVYTSNGRKIQCQERTFASGTSGRLGVCVKCSGPNECQCIHMLNGKPV